MTLSAKSGPGYCENCGERVYKLGCVNCDEEAYIEEQRHWDGPALSMEEALADDQEKLYALGAEPRPKHEDCDCMECRPWTT